MDCKKDISWWRTSFGNDEIRNFREAVLNEHISLGPITESLEKRIADELKVPYAIVTTSGSVALLMSVMALGIGPEDEVIIPNRTWIATAHAPLIREAKVTLVDVLKDKPIIDLDQLERKINSKTKAIIPVHLNGRDSNMEEIKNIAKEHKLYVIEDACQALFSKNKTGFLGTQSDIGCYSLGVTKLVSTGQGGIAVTHNKEVYEKLKLIRNHGTISVLEPKYCLIGCNFKFTDLLASVGLAQISRLDEKKSQVYKIYERYSKDLEELDYIKMIPVDIKNGELPIYIETMCNDRVNLVRYLNNKKIYPREFLPNISSASYIGNSESFPNSDEFAKKGLFLPCGPGQSFENIDYVIDALKKFKGGIT